jgi:hypothetical protein
MTKHEGGKLKRGEEEYLKGFLPGNICGIVIMFFIVDMQ